MISLIDSKYSFVAGAATTVSGQATSLDAQNVAQVAGQPRQALRYTQKVQLYRAKRLTPLLLSLVSRSIFRQLLAPLRHLWQCWWLGDTGTSCQNLLCGKKDHGCEGF